MYVNILEFIGILQFSQINLTFEINVEKGFKKMIARNFNVVILVHFVSTQRFKASCNHFYVFCNP